MLAWMNRVALEQTISTGFMTYWSRSRQKLWLKGETSGHHQLVQSISFDCDGDAVLCKSNKREVLVILGARTASISILIWMERR